MALTRRGSIVALWRICLGILLGLILTVVGCGMAAVGYFANDLASVNNSTHGFAVDETRRLQIRSLSYIGPIIMGAGAFILMIACVTTLESRDKRTSIREAAYLSLHSELSKKCHHYSPEIETDDNIEDLRNRECYVFQEERLETTTL